MAGSPDVAADCQVDLGEGIRYWSGVQATINGVLGGYGNGSLPRVDVLGSRLFLLSCMPELSSIEVPVKSRSPRLSKSTGGLRRALDVGAGIGRVTSQTLLPLLDRVDMVEPVAAFVDRAREDSIRWVGISDNTRAVRFWQMPLQSFDPAQALKTPLPSPERNGYTSFVGSDRGWDAKYYDVIWCQWALGHLTDRELTIFLRRARAALRPPSTDEKGGIIIVKENITSSTESVFDPEDSSVTRSDQVFRQIFHEAGLTIVKQDKQTGLPLELYRVNMYALR